MKRQRDIGSLPQAEQFHALGSVQGLSNASRRKVVNLYSSQDTGRRTQARPGQIYRKAHGALREMTLAGHPKGYVNFPYFSLAEILEAKVTACALFRASLSACCGEWNGGKVQLIVYVDECTAGNVVAPDPTRKACMVYVTILGMSLLHLESQWLTAALFRTSDMQKVQGGLAQAIQVLLESWQEEWSTGILVSLDHGPQLLFVDRIILLADADGLRAATGCKGAAGNVPCARCANVRSHSAILSAPEGCVCIAEPNVSNFQLLSQARLDAILEELSSERTKKGLQDKETQVGWNFIPLRLSCLASRSLRAVMDITSVHFDPMHIYWSNGMIPQELGLWWSSLQDNSNVKISVLQEFVNMGWIAYKESNSQVLRLVGDKMWKRGADYRGNATQSMLCLCLCVQFQEEILRERLPRLSPEFDSLRALYELQVYVLRCKFHNGSEELLSRAQEKHQRLFQNAYGQESTRPKAHFSRHLPAQISRFGKLLDTFTPERKHRAFKTEASPNAPKISNFSKVCLLKLGERELQENENVDALQDRLEHPTDASMQTRALFGHAAVKCVQESKVLLRGSSGQRLQQGMLLQLNNSTTVEMLQAVKADETLYLLVEIWRPDHTLRVNTNPCASCWKKTNEGQVLLQTKNMQCEVPSFFRREYRGEQAYATLLR